MKLNRFGKKVLYEDTIDVLNECISNLEVIKGKIIVKNDLPSVKYDEEYENEIFDEVINWYQSLTYKDFS